jgi:hypothetical protein
MIEQVEAFPFGALIVMGVALASSIVLIVIGVESKRNKPELYRELGIPGILIGLCMSISVITLFIDQTMVESVTYKVTGTVEDVQVVNTNELTTVNDITVSGIDDKTFRLESGYLESVTETVGSNIEMDCSLPRNGSADPIRDHPIVDCHFVSLA